jgi:hypothetical protein
MEWKGVTLTVMKRAASSAGLIFDKTVQVDNFQDFAKTQSSWPTVWTNITYQGSNDQSVKGSFTVSLGKYYNYYNILTGEDFSVTDLSQATAQVDYIQLEVTYTSKTSSGALIIGVVTAAVVLFVVVSTIIVVSYLW